MNESHRSQRSVFNKNPHEKRILQVVFLLSTIPVFLIILLFFALFSDLIYTYIHTDLGQHFLDRVFMLCALILLYYIIFARLIFRLVHRMFGAYERIIRELDSMLAGGERHTIHLRKNDFGQDIVERINKLIQN
ncbi:MAG TPA: hypothetical protein PLT76_08345 [Candidatus Omnitrophota bacterium]|mgnify:FL=1|nr:hypothetical protein [Candidatus Omnitrophota bacterium]HQO58710.1 hypothetical protein [Candidatus Omnitrophota bacterium]